MNAKPRHVERALHEPVEIVPYDPGWPALFAAEAEHLRALLPAVLIGRIEHFGSTAVPGLAAKPIVDMLLEVRSMEDVARRIRRREARGASRDFGALRLQSVAARRSPRPPRAKRSRLPCRGQPVIFRA